MDKITIIQRRTVLRQRRSGGIASDEELLELDTLEKKEEVKTFWEKFDELKVMIEKFTREYNNC